MTAYEPGDAEEVVTRGVHTHTPDEAVDQIHAFDAMSLLGPTVPLAHLEVLPGGTPSGEVRTRWTVPGAPLARAGSGSELLCTQLGLIDASVHTEAVGADESGSGAPDGPTGHLSLRWPSELAWARDRWRPPLTLSLVADADAVRVTDRGLWVIRLPPQMGHVPLGYNLAVYLTTASVPAHEVSQALSRYRQALVAGIRSRYPQTPYCVCGRTPGEHVPTDEQVGHYSEIRSAIGGGPPPDPRGPDPDQVPAARPARRVAGGVRCPAEEPTGTG